MGYKDENIKHRLGIKGEPKFQCPKCKNGLDINKPKFMVVCSKCKNIIEQDLYCNDNIYIYSNDFTQDEVIVGLDEFTKLY